MQGKSLLLLRGSTPAWPSGSAESSTKISANPEPQRRWGNAAADADIHSNLSSEFRPFSRPTWNSKKLSTLLPFHAVPGATTRNCAFLCVLKEFGHNSRAASAAEKNSLPQRQGRERTTDPPPPSHSHFPFLLLSHLNDVAPAFDGDATL